MLNPSDLNNQAHIWYCRLDSPQLQSDPAAFEQQLSAEEGERYQRFRFERDRHLYLIAHVFMRQVLTYYTGLTGDRLEFSKNQYGRPELVQSGRLDTLRFNLSHTRGVVALIITASKD